MMSKFFFIALFCFSASFAALSPEDFILDRAKLLSEEERTSYSAIAGELHAKTGFSLYLFTAESEVLEPTRVADSLLQTAAGEDSIRAVLFLDISTRHRGFSLSNAAQKFFSKDAAESNAQKFMLPEFRKGRYGFGILLFEAEAAKHVARMHDVRLQVPLPQPEKDGIPTIAWILILAVAATVIIAYAYFSRQAALARQREGFREFGGFPHDGFNSGFGK